MLRMFDAQAALYEPPPAACSDQLPVTLTFVAVLQPTSGLARSLLSDHPFLGSPPRLGHVPSWDPARFLASPPAPPLNALPGPVPSPPQEGQ